MRAHPKVNSAAVGNLRFTLTRTVAGALLLGCAAHTQSFRAAASDHVPDEMQSCDADADCVQEPATCHVTACVARDAIGSYRARRIDPEECTEEIRPEDLSPGDACLCVRRRCVNPHYDHIEAVWFRGYPANKDRSRPVHRTLEGPAVAHGQRATMKLIDGPLFVDALETSGATVTIYTVKASERCGADRAGASDESVAPAGSTYPEHWTASTLAPPGRHGGLGFVEPDSKLCASATTDDSNGTAAWSVSIHGFLPYAD